MRRALDNLLSNAFRYGKPPITVSGRIDGTQLLIDVRDSGPGMSPEEAGKLMRPFARGNTARGGEGTGLGLAIVHQVAKAHEGNVEFEQNIGSFTARIRLPLSVVA